LSSVTIANYGTATTNAAVAAISWGTSATICDATKWDTTTACHSVDLPWASTTYTEWVTGTPATEGKVRAWHFLAEKNADVAKNFQIEKDNKINWIIEEKYQTLTVSTAAADSANANSAAHYYGTFTSTGATSTILGATAIIAGVVASMF
jgi:hypothetical protein